MTGGAKSSLASYRARMERKGFVRVEVNVRKEDANLVRRIAAALSDPRARPKRACFFGSDLSSRPRRA